MLQKLPQDPVILLSVINTKPEIFIRHWISYAVRWK